MPESKGRRQRKTNSSRARRRGSGTSTTPSAPETGRKFTWPRLGFRLRARTWRRVRRWSFIGAAAMFAALIIGSFALSSFPGGIFGQGGAASADGAQIGNHWHASLLMEVCGQDIDLPPSDGGIHSHGDRFIHIHPYIADEVGLAANIGRFFDSFPLEMDFDRVETPKEGSSGMATPALTVLQARFKSSLMGRTLPRAPGDIPPRTKMRWRSISDRLRGKSSRMFRSKLTRRSRRTRSSRVRDVSG